MISRTALNHSTEGKTGIALLHIRYGRLNLCRISSAPRDGAPPAAASRRGQGGAQARLQPPLAAAEAGPAQPAEILFDPAFAERAQPFAPGLAAAAPVAEQGGERSGQRRVALQVRGEQPLALVQVTLQLGGPARLALQQEAQVAEAVGQVPRQIL